MRACGRLIDEIALICSVETGIVVMHVAIHSSLCLEKGALVDHHLGVQEK
jgi:hypothetical protein